MHDCERYKSNTISHWLNVFPAIVNIWDVNKHMSSVKVVSNREFGRMKHGKTLSKENWFKHYHSAIDWYLDSSNLIEIASALILQIDERHRVEVV